MRLHRHVAGFMGKAGLAAAKRLFQPLAGDSEG